MSRLRIALIGAGRIARDWVLVLEGSPDFELVGVVDPSLAARQRAAALALAPTHATIDELLDAGAVDAALVASPPNDHCASALRLLAAGCHVLCEKPLATGTADAERMLQAAGRAERVLMMATKFRFVDDVIRAGEILAAGELGDLVFYANAFCACVDMADRWNSDPAIAGGGVLIDNGTHAIDLARCLAGPIARVAAVFGPRLQPLAVEDSALLLFEADRGALGRIDLSWSIDRSDPWFVELACSRGTLQIGWRGSRVRAQTGDWLALGDGYDKLRAFAAQLAHFAAVCRGECPPRVDGEDALASVRIVDAAYRAAARGTWQQTASMEPAR